MLPSYERTLSTHAKSLLATGAQLRFLIETDWGAHGLPSHAIDLQLRADDVVMLYHGTTRPLAGRIRNGIAFMADPAYQTWCGVSATRLLKQWPAPVSDAVQGHVAEYLKQAVIAVTREQPSHFLKEGYWQNRLALKWGRTWSAADPFLVFDREVVLGFLSEEDRTRYLAPIATPYEQAAKIIQAGAGATWAKRRPDAHRELDFLAIDAEGELVCIELKHGSNAAGIYWGPLQVGHYRDALAAALPHIQDSLRSLIEQKIELGLLPATARDRLHGKQFGKVSGALLVAEPPSSQSKVWPRLRTIQEQLGTRRADVFLVEDLGGRNTLRDWK